MIRYDAGTRKKIIERHKAGERYCDIACSLRMDPSVVARICKSRLPLDKIRVSKRFVNGSNPPSKVKVKHESNLFEHDIYYKNYAW